MGRLASASWSNIQVGTVHVSQATQGSISAEGSGMRPCGSKRETAPAAAFCARGLALAGERWQRGLLALSATAALVAALLFTNRLTFTTAPASGQPWDPIIEAYPSSHL